MSNENEGNVTKLHAVVNLGSRRQREPQLTDEELIQIRRLLVNSAKIQHTCPIAQRAILPE